MKKEKENTIWKMIKNIFSSVPVQLQSITDPHRSFNIINGSTTFAVLQKRFGCKPAAL